MVGVTVADGGTRFESGANPARLEGLTILPENRRHDPTTEPECCSGDWTPLNPVIGGLGR